MQEGARPSAVMSSRNFSRPTGLIVESERGNEGERNDNTF